MANKALGLIEVKGLLGAILAADEALKSANVRLVGNRRIRGGLTTVHLVGDVASVKAAVEAGVNVVKNSNMYVSSHVIARIDVQVENMITKMLDQSKESEKELNRELDQEQIDLVSRNAPDDILETEHNDQNQEKSLSTEESIHVSKEIPNISKEQLSEMRVVELRSLAYKMNLETLTKKEIKFGSKDKLIQALLEKGVNND